MEGFIQLHRSIQEHWIYKEKCFSNIQAWIDICLSANHKDNKFLLGNELIEVKRGSFITSELKLMNRFGWSKSKLRNFLKLLQLDKMIEKISDKNKTSIIVLNYEKYQGIQTSKRPVKDQGKTTKEPQEDTNNNDNNDNNDNKYFSNEKLNQVFLEFIKFRKEKKTIMTRLAITKSVNKINGFLEKYSIDDVIGFIDNSIISNWDGIFEQKSKAFSKKETLTYENPDSRNDFKF